MKLLDNWQAKIEFNNKIDHSTIILATLDYRENINLNHHGYHSYFQTKGKIFVEVSGVTYVRLTKSNTVFNVRYCDDMFNYMVRQSRAPVKGFSTLEAVKREAEENVRAAGFRIVTEDMRVLL